MSNLEGGACYGVGTYDNPCTLIAPDGFDFGVDTSGDYFYWKSGCFKASNSSSFASGDVNHDGTVNVTDVMLTVSYILGDIKPSFHYDEANVNNDTNVNVTDVMLIVNIILNKPLSAPVGRHSTDQLILYGQLGDCTLLLDGAGTFTACQMTLTLPEGCTLLDASLAFDLSDGHLLETNYLGNGQYNVVVYSPQRRMFGSGPLLHLNISGNYASGIQISDVMMVDTRIEPVVLDSVDGVATDITDIFASEASQDIYNVQGMKMKTLRRGVNIRKNRKVVVK